MDDEDVRRGAGGDLSDNPLLAQLVVVKMEDLQDNLKLLNYEVGFCKKLKLKPFPRHYFAIPTNPGEQFFAFTNLAVWLLGECGKKQLEQPQEYDDPNATIATIVAEAKSLGVSTNFPPAKLKSGAGEQVCTILCEISERALKAKKFSWKKPVYQEDSTQEETEAEEGVELCLSQMDEEIQEDALESEEEEAMFIDLGGLNQVKNTEDWRSHLEQMHQYKGKIHSTLSETTVHLDKLHQEITKTLEKIESREKYINKQLEQQIQELRLSKDRLAQIREQYNQASSGVTDLSRELAQVTEDMEAVKAEMDEKGTSMTDAGPLVRIKQALTRLKTESTQMDVRIGVVEHTLLDAKFKKKSAIQKQMNQHVSVY